MNIERKAKVQKWGELDVSLFGATKDWEGNALAFPVGFSFAIDPEYFWFIATCASPPVLHPQAQSGEFVSELWKYDVAEFFLTNPMTGRYLEFNLAPNGAWWAAEFTGPREGMGQAPLQGVDTYHDLAPDGRWIAAARFQLKEFKERFSLSPDSTLNAAFIIGSPEQQFISATDLGGGEPDFHQPEKFPPARFIHEDELRQHH